MKSGVIILGSSNSTGDTYQLASYVNQKTSFPIIDLKTKHILEFDYEFKNQNDDFLPTFKYIVDNYDLLIFATPVYWYSMSGIMKTFFDRISDFLKVESLKDTGRKLRGKEMAVISCASDGELIPGFYMPFMESANYLGMQYLGAVHGWIENNKTPEEVQQKLDDFTKTIL